MPVPSMAVLQACKSAAGAWSPLDLSGLALWLDASDAGSFTYSSGTLVSQWNDLSGNAKHATQSTASYQPSRNSTLNGLDTVHFDGTDNHMLVPNLSLSQPFWTWGVFKNGTVVNDEPWFMQTSPLIVVHMGWSGSGTTHIAYAGGTGLSKSPILSNDTAYCWGILWSGASSYERINGVASTTGNLGADSLTSASGFVIGQNTSSTQCADFHLAEQIFVSGTMTGDEIAALEAYTTAKWGKP